MRERWADDSRFAGADARDAHAVASPAELGVAPGAATAVESEERLLTAGVPAAHVRTPPEALGRGALGE